MAPILEVCVDCVESALNAVKGGASRLELCSALSEGGLTPTPGLLKAVNAAVKIPIFCILRPRRGDFVYSSEEIEAMKVDAMLLRAVGRVDGFVLGALTSQGDIDVVVCRELLQAVNPLPATFHRAIDVCVDPIAAVDVIIQLGFKRILTSGCKQSAEEGIEMIKNMIARAGSKIIIMPGAGISPKNAGKVISETNAIEIHASARQLKLSLLPSSSCSMGSADSSESFMITNEETVANIILSISSIVTRNYTPTLNKISDE